jgi:O-antigen ligase
MAVSATATVSAGLALSERFIPGIALHFDGVGLGAHLDDQSLDSGVAIMRVTGGIGDANWFSYTMATALPLCLFWFRAYSNLWVRSAAVVMALMQLAGIVLSYTRTPLIGLAGAVAFLLWKRMLPLLPMSLLAGAALISSPAWLPDGFIDRIWSERYLKEGSTPMRREIFSMAIDLIRERPLLGYGYQQFGKQFIQRSKTDIGWEWERRDESGEEPAHLLRAHNLYLDVWVQHGAVGLTLLVLAYALLLRELAEVSRIARPRDAELAICLASCLLAFLLCGLGGHSQELKIFWVLAGLAAGLRRVVISGYPVAARG